MHKRRAAISNIIAVLMLTMISVTAASILYVYSTGLFGSLQAPPPQDSYLEHIAMEYYNWTSSQLNIRVRNVGSARIKIVQIYISGTSVASWQSPDCPSIQSGYLNVQSSCLVQIAPPVGLTLTGGIAYSVSFATASGGQTTFSLTYLGAG